MTVLNDCPGPRTDLVRVEVPTGDWSLLDDAGARHGRAEGRTLPPRPPRPRRRPAGRTCSPGPGRAWAGSRGRPAVEHPRTTPTGRPPTSARGGIDWPWLDRRLGRELIPARPWPATSCWYDEYPQHPTLGEARGTCCPPAGPGRRGVRPAAQPCSRPLPAGQRLVVAGELDGARHEQTLHRPGPDCRGGLHHPAAASRVGPAAAASAGRRRASVFAGYRSVPWWSAAAAGSSTSTRPSTRADAGQPGVLVVRLARGRPRGWWPAGRHRGGGGRGGGRRAVGGRRPGPGRRAGPGRVTSTTSLDTGTGTARCGSTPTCWTP